MLTREAILAAKPALAPFPAPEWGGDIWLRTLSMDDLLTWEAARAPETDPDAKRRNYTARVVLGMLGAAGPDGERLFGEADMDWLRAQPWKLMERLEVEVLRHNGLLSAQQDAAAGN
jgi:hypothetical protein